MPQAPAAIFKIPTESPQPAPAKAVRKPAARLKKARPSPGRVVTHETRAATRGDGEVIELEYGIVVYPAREEGNAGDFRAVWRRWLLAVSAGRVCEGWSGRAG